MKDGRVEDPIVQEVDGRDRLFCPVEGCPHEYATQKGYATRRGYEAHFRKYHLASETVAFISRLDYGSPGFRKGFLDVAFKTIRDEGARFIILAGGLISLPHLKKQLTYQALDELWERTWGADYAGIKKPARAERVERAREMLYDRWADELAEAIPQLKVGGRYIKIYVVTSPAPNYDGVVGAEIARRLAQRRPDILYWGERSVRFSLKYQNKTLWVLVPLKASWRSRYFSTTPDRLIQDEQKQTSHPLPDLWVVGCVASDLQRPQGENARPYISAPALHNLQEIHTSENQVGIKMVEFFPQSDEFLVRNYSYKDLAAREREWIPDPKGATDLQRAIVSSLKVEGAMTVGMLEDAVQAARSKITAAIEELNSSGYQPAIVLDSGSQRYDFDGRWIQHKLTYPVVDGGKLHKDVILAFGCLHAGSIFTNYRWFVGQVPKLILEHGATVLVGAGDFIEGLKHNLMERGEVLGGANYTQQERLAARMIGTVMLKVFKDRLAKSLNGKKRPSGKQLRELVANALLTFFFNEGNHDEWVEKMGVEPLATFHPALVKYLASGIGEILKEHGLELPGLTQLVEEKVVFGETHKLPSGLKIAILHPHMSRTLTSSLRAQHALDATDAQLVVIANFHVAINVGQWQSDIGQRDAMQVGAIVWRTSYEHGKLKELDVGVGHLTVFSDDEGRVLVTEAAFFNCKDREMHGNDALLQAFAERVGI